MRIIESCDLCGLENCNVWDSSFNIPSGCPLPKVEDKTVSAFQAGINHAIKMANKNVPDVTFNDAYEEWRKQNEPIRDREATMR